VSDQTGPDTGEPAMTDWEMRALQAEAVIHHALRMRPLPSMRDQDLPETAAEMASRFRQHVERTYPDIIVRDEHRRIAVFAFADSCGCDPDAEDSDDYDDAHDESDVSGEYLCSRSFLGYVCNSCTTADDGGGPAWRPQSVEWPCPPIADLDKPRTPAVARPPARATVTFDQWTTLHLTHWAITEFGDQTVVSGSLPRTHVWPTVGPDVPIGRLELPGWEPFADITARVTISNSGPDIVLTIGFPTLLGRKASV
jgi:hypothetical protein